MITLAKTPRPFIALVQDGKVINTLPEPATDEATEELAVEVFTHCLEVHNLTAIDRFDAHSQAMAYLSN
ncbi:hypothetical protein [Streptomyces cahuitamycinicus]|uniref:Uncharacterized protein n=1 Tax=Streptomyces cahuitamycinicus TaxID=2070367 RepID=A0A2N8TAP0_9ACTN|nr:hypothetical protein [Streptomyces cahuitamycinicus]PNG16085.1 hypothetical protein C1J00_43995 [Streptomyces cahuitamycinicus]